MDLTHLKKIAKEKLISQNDNLNNFNNCSLEETYKKCLSPDETDFLCPLLCGEIPKANKAYNWDCFVDEDFCKSSGLGSGCVNIKSCGQFNNKNCRIIRRENENEF